MHYVKLLLKILLGSIITLVLAITVLLVVIDPNDFKEDIQKIVQQQTGREFEMNSIELSIFPKFGLSLEKAQLSNAQGFSDRPFAEINTVNIGAEILPLLSQQIVVDALTLNGLRLSLETNENGETNWQDLSNPSNSSAAENTSEPANQDPLEALKQLDFGGMNINNSELIWDDRSTGQNIAIKDLNIQSGAIAFGNYFPIEITASTSLKQPNLNNQITLKLEAMLASASLINTRNIQINNQLSSPELPLKTVTTSIEIPTFSYDLNASEIAINRITLNNQAIGQADFIAQQLATDISVNNLQLNLQNQVYSVENLSAEARMQADSLGLTTEDVIQVKTQLSADLNTQIAKLDQLNIQALDTQTSGQISVDKLIDNPIVTGNINTKDFNLKQLLTKLQITLPETNSPTALQKVGQSMAFKLDLAEQTFNLSKLTVNLDQSILKGSTQVSNFSKPAIEFDFALDSIRVDDYLPPKANTQQEGATEPESAPNTQTQDIEIPLPKELIRQLDIQGQVQIADLHYQQLNPKNILLKLKAQKGLVEILPAQADIFNTQVSIQSTLDVREETPKYAAKVTAPKVPIGEVLLAFTQDDPLTGLGSIDANLTATGEKLSLLKSSLTGTADVDFANGAIKGFNLAQLLRETKAKISGKPAPKDDAPQKTDFSRLIAKVDINSGLVTSREIQAMSPFLRVDGTGQAHLAQETIDFVVKTKIVNTSKGQGGEGLEELKGLTIPVKLSGDLMAPKISLDLESLIDAKLKQKLEQKKAALKAEAKAKLKAKEDEIKAKAKAKLEEKVEDKIEGQVQDQLKDALKGFGF